ncbi:MAG: hypothetical protein JXX14_10745, partial [Deltaproteobacteria bacterium]|nr:hypothetical protein [Deltaproteobacteria bacterium]
CDDGDACNGVETCDSATGCVAGTSLVCDDNDVCTSDSCDTATGCAFVFMDADGDAVCDAEDLCPGSDDALDGDGDGIPDDCDECPGAGSAGALCGDAGECDSMGVCIELIECVPGASGPGVYDGSIVIDSENPAILYSGVTCVTGDLSIVGGVSDLTGLESLQQVWGRLGIFANPALTDVDELSNVTSVGSLEIGNNATLGDLAGLSNLTEITEANTPYDALIIAENPMLAPCEIWAIEASTGKTCSSCENNTGTGNCGTLPADFVCEPGAVGPGV